MGNLRKLAAGAVSTGLLVAGGLTGAWGVPPAEDPVTPAATEPTAPALQQPVPITAPADGSVDITVMARNIYLGSDVGKALELLPDLSAASEFMWDEVQATDFPARVPYLAQEAAAAKPAVIGLQEATTWNCRAGLFGQTTTVYDFTQQFIDATAAAGVPYVVAEAAGKPALNPGYTIGPIPGLTIVEDPATFQPLFGTDSAACGFELADALLVRKDLADKVTASGTTEFDTKFAVVPWLFEVDRGFAWADMDFDGVPVRFVTTHLESMWPVDKQNPGAEQARELVAQLSTTEIPVVVIGDINNDPRDPRPVGVENPAGQPEEGDVCEGQVADPTPETALSQCNAYWALVQAGYTDVGPDAMNPDYYTWGSNGLLAGPDPRRIDAALAMGNDAGWTDRLDYVLVKNGVTATSAVVIGNEWPVGPDNWSCTTEAQVAYTEDMSARLAEAGVAEAVTGEAICFPSDHAGIVAQLKVTAPPAGAAAPALDTNESFINRQLVALAVLGMLTLSVFGLITWGIVALVRRIRNGRDGQPPAAATAS